MSSGCPIILRGLSDYKKSVSCSEITESFPFPTVCTADSDCPFTHFCGSGLPTYGSNFYDNSDSVISGETVFLQQSEMRFDGQSVVSLPTSVTTSISNHLTIFATVRQDPGNDGYIVGKGINDRMRDFGLYFRSTKRTVWLAYGSDGVSPGFREILFFYNISIADGKPHSIAAVIDSSVNRAVLYIDGEVAAQRTSLPSVPEFRPEVSSNLICVTFTS